MELIHMKTKTNQIDKVVNLNLWGNDLDDVSIMMRMPSLELVSLSVNHITTLRHFSDCRRMRELHMRNNKIKDLNEIKYLQDLPIKILQMSENPISTHPLYRKFCIRCLPNLEKLDNNPVSYEEREQAEITDFSNLDSYD